MQDVLKMPLTDAATEETEFPWAVHFGKSEILAIEPKAGRGAYTFYEAEDPGLATITFRVIDSEPDLVTFLVSGHKALATTSIVSPSIVASTETWVGTHEYLLVGPSVTDATGQLVTDSAAATRIRRLRDAFGISASDVAKIIGTASDLVDDVESGRSKLPATYNAKLTDASRALDRLLGIFRRDRLASVIRRPARAFGGQTPLEWILDGRIEEVAERYHYGLAYQS